MTNFHLYQDVQSVILSHEHREYYLSLQVFVKILKSFEISSSQMHHKWTHVDTFIYCTDQDSSGSFKTLRDIMPQNRKK